MADVLRRLFPPPPTLPVVPPGMYHRMTAAPLGSPYRLHLRVDGDGRGLLIVNASTVLHLNQTATAYAWHLLHGTDDEQAAQWVAQRFRITRGRARRDGRLIRDQIEALAEGEDQDPVVVMGMERLEPFADRPPAPYRLDLALTFRTADESRQDPRARRTVGRELETDEWKAVLSQAWTAGIPHVVFTGGEPTIRADLPALIRHAENLGQVSGVVTGGERLSDAARMDRLLRAGVDHLLVVVDANNPASLDGLKRAVEADVFCAAHLTFGPAAAAVETQLRQLKSLGVSRVSVSAPPGPAGETALRVAQQEMAELGLSLVWDLPVPYSRHNPLRLELADRAMGRAWLYVEPDGDVLPTQGEEPVLGSLLRDSILALWQRDSQSTSPTSPERPPTTGHSAGSASVPAA